MIYEEKPQFGQSSSLYIADDQDLLREGVKAVFHNVPWARIVGEARNAAEAFTFVKSSAPDLVMLDPCLPGGGGVDCVKRIQEMAEETKIIVLTNRESEDWVYECLEAGAQGYLMKSASSQELLAGVKAVLDGNKYLSSNIIMNVAKGYVEGRRSSEPATLVGSLTKREHEVFELVGQGQKNREIAEQLYISIKTVEKHRANMMHKLQLKRPVHVRRLWKDWVATN